MGYNDELIAKYNSYKTKPRNYNNFELLMKHSYRETELFHEYMPQKLWIIVTI